MTTGHALVLPSNHLIGYENLVGTLKSNRNSLEEAILLQSELIRHTPETGLRLYKFQQWNFTCKSGCIQSCTICRKTGPTAANTLRQESISGTAECSCGKVSSNKQQPQGILCRIYTGRTEKKAGIQTDSFDEVLSREFHSVRSESIDFGIMEKPIIYTYIYTEASGWDEVELACVEKNKRNRWG